MACILFYTYNCIIRSTFKIYCAMFKFYFKITIIINIILFQFNLRLQIKKINLILASYIRACGRKDSNYDQCIIDNLNVKDKLCTGFPEFNISPIEPLIFDPIVIYDTDKLKLYLRDAKLKGICDYIVNSVHTDSDRLQIDFEVTLKQITIDTSYDFDTHVLVPLAHKGLVSITTGL